MFLACLLAAATIAASRPSIDQLREGLAWPSGTEAVGGSTDPDQDCEVAQLAYAFGLQALPELAPNRELFDALELHTKCKQPVPPPSPSGPPPPPSFPIPSPGSALYVDATKGDDAGPGTEAHPLKTVGAALANARGRTPTAADGGGGGRVVVLRAGVHHLAATLSVDAALSGLVLQNYPGEKAWVSGGEPLPHLSWAPVDMAALLEHPPAMAPSVRVYSAKLDDVARVPGLNKLV